MRVEPDGQRAAAASGHGADRAEITEVFHVPDDTFSVFLNRVIRPGIHWVDTTPYCPAGVEFMAPIYAGGARPDRPVIPMPFGKGDDWKFRVIDWRDTGFLAESRHDGEFNQQMSVSVKNPPPPTRRSGITAATTIGKLLDDPEWPEKVRAMRELAERGHRLLEGFVLSDDGTTPLLAWISECDAIVGGYGQGKLTQMRTTDPSGAAPPTLSSDHQGIWRDARRHIDWLRHEVKDD
jgi:hypothetical protein